MKNKPNIIYLQLGHPGDSEEFEDFNDRRIAKNEITWNTECIFDTDLPYYSEEFVIEFARWCGKHFERVAAGWIKVIIKEKPVKLYTTKELLEQFKKLKDGTTRQT